MSSGDHEINTAANVIVTRHDHPFWRASFHHCVEHDVGYVLVEVTLIAEAPEELLEALRFEALFSGAIFDGNGREIGLTSQRAERCKFDSRKFNGVVIIRMRIRKSFDGFGRS